MRKALIITAVLVAGILSLSLGERVGGEGEDPSSPAEVDAGVAPTPAWPVVRGRVSGEPSRWYAATRNKDGVELCPLDVHSYLSCAALDALPMSELLEMPLGSASKRSTLVLEERLVGTLSPEALAHSKFVADAVAASRARHPPFSSGMSVYSALMEFDRRGGSRKALDAKQLAKWVTAHRDDDELYDAFAHYREFGPDTMDVRPTLAAALFAELALARGDVPTLVDMHIEQLTDFFWVAWVAESDTAAPTRADRLALAAVDVDALLLGLVIQHEDAPRKNISAWRLGRAMHEAGRGATLLPRLEALATSRQLDPFNRFRATNVWLGLHHFAGTPAPTVKSKAATLDLNAPARELVESVYR